nr:hypothetical protein [Algoriphagus locisalis]
MFLRLLLIGLFFSCGEKRHEGIYQGKLEELIVGEFVMTKDSTTSRIKIDQVLTIGNQEYLVSGDKQNIRFYSSRSGKMDYDYPLPLAGPYSFDDAVGSFHVGP